MLRQILVGGLVWLAVITAINADELNAIKNGGFEDGKGNYMRNWGVYPKNIALPNAITRDARVKHSGNYSAKICYKQKLPKGTPPLQINQYGIKLSSAFVDGLIFKVYLRSDKENAAISLGIHYYDANKKHLEFQNIRFGGISKDKWQLFKRKITPPKGAVAMGMAFYGSLGNAIWLDDIELLSTPKLQAVYGVPELDGMIKDSCWRNENRADKFRECYGRNNPKSDIKAWVSYGKKNIYLAFKIGLPQGEKPKTVCKYPDSNLMTDDSINIFISPDAKSCYHLAFNANGVLYDAERKNTIWNSQAKIVNKVSDNYWQAEVMIPFSSFQKAIRQNKQWKMNFIYINSRKNLIYSWSPIYVSELDKKNQFWSIPGFFQVDRFGKVTVNANLSSYLLSNQRELLLNLDREISAFKDKLQEINLDSLKDDIAKLQNIKNAILALKNSKKVNQKSLDNLSKKFSDLQQKVAGKIYSVTNKGKIAPFKVLLIDSMIKVPQDGVGIEALAEYPVKIEAAGDETESFQIVIKSDKMKLPDVIVKTESLTNDSGDKIPLECSLVEYVETNKPKNFIPDYVGWWPDILVPMAKFTVSPGKCQPIWVRIDVPTGAKAGIYRGSVTILARSKEVTVPISLHVRAFSLPRPGTFPVAMGLYPNINRDWQKRKKGSPFTAKKFLEWCDFLAKYRISVKNIAREYCPEIKNNKKVSYNVSAIAPTLKKLIKDAYPKDSFAIYRTPTNYGLKNSSSNATKVVAQCEGFIRAYEKNNISGNMFIYGVDEVRENRFQAVTDLYKAIRGKVTKKYPILQTVSHEAPVTLVGLVDIWCPLTRNLSRDPENFYQKRFRAGDKLWMYVAMVPNPPRANFFIDEAGIDHRILFWQAWQHNVTGFLYWTTNWWIDIRHLQPMYPEAPIRFGKLKKKLDYNGDGILLWPGPNMTPYPSIRLEIIRDGIEDYEYLALLRKEVKRVSKLQLDRKKTIILKAAEQLLIIPDNVTSSMTRFTKSPAVLRKRRKLIGDMIEQLMTIK